MIITISGMVGSGKSTASKLLAKKLGYKHYSAGDMQREIAEEHNISIAELGKLEATDDKYDRMVDERFKQLGEREDNFVADGWLLAHFIPQGFNIFLIIDPEESLKRRIKQQPRNSEQYTDPKEAKKLLLEREKVNKERWIRYYDFDYTDQSNYDLVVDTTSNPPEIVVEKILKSIK